MAVFRKAHLAGLLAVLTGTAVAGRLRYGQHVVEQQ